MLAVIALFIVPVLVMEFRHKFQNISEMGAISIIRKYAFTVFEECFCTLFVARYFIIRSAFDINAFSSVQFFLKYCMLALAIGIFLVCVEKYAKEYIQEGRARALRDKFIYTIQKISSMLEAKAGITYGKHQYHIDEIIFVIVGLAVAILTVGRCFFGIEITDEAYYVADAYSVVQGNLPFAYNTSNAAGMSLVTFPFMWMFRLFSTDNGGVFLYMRLCYVIFRFVVIFLIYVILRKRYSRRGLLPACMVLVAWNGPIPNFSYNTSSFWLMLLSCVIIQQVYTENYRKRCIGLIIAGGISALSVFAHPMQAGAVLMLCILLMLLSNKKNKALNVMMYVAGGILQVMIVLLSIAAQVGMRSLLTGIDVMLFHRMGYEGNDVKQSLMEFALWLKPIYYKLVIVFFVSMAVFWLFNKFLKIEWGMKYRWLMSSVLALAFTSIYYGRVGSDYDLLYFGALSFWAMAMIFSIVRDPLVCFISAPFLTFFLCEIVFPGTANAVVRVYFMYPILFVAIILLFEKSLEICNSKTNNSMGKTLRILSALFALIIAILMIRSEYLFVYRDDPISQLDYKVTEGIYKGIYTSKDNAECTIEVERYIKDNTGSKELISFRDNVPFGYLMSNGIMCDIRTWDAMQYSYIEPGAVKDSPVNMYRYYKNTGNIPDKYIYIDYGRDEIVSYDSQTFKFNKWLNSYYDEVDDIKINDRYSARIYKYNGSFDGNYDYWIQSTQ